jgi:hypothetical protein
LKTSCVTAVAVALLFVFCGSCIVLSTHARPNPAAPGYHLLKTVHLPAAPGNIEYFDYITVDPDARRVYVSHATEVVVLNADDATVLGKISGLKRCHGVVIIKSLGKGFITDEGAESVLVFDPATLNTTGEIKTHQTDTDSIVYEPVTKHIFTFNGHSHNATVIDPLKEAVITNIELVRGVEFSAVDGKGMIYDNNEDNNDVVAIDARTNTVKARWPAAPAGQLVAMAMDQKNRRLFSSGRDPQYLVMMDADNGKVLQSFPITAGVDSNVFEPSTGLLFVSTREGMIHIYHEDSPDKLSEVETVKTEYGAKTMQLDPKTHKLFLSTSDFDPPAAPTEKEPHPLPRAKQGNFRVLVYGR